MKRLLILAATFAAVTLLMPQIGQAQAFTNQLGIYSDPLGTPASANFNATPNVAFNAYLVLTNPMNDTFDGGVETKRSITMVNAFECRVTMPTSSHFLNLGVTYPVDAINFGEGSYYIVGFAPGVPVTNNAVVLCTWELMVTDAAEYNIMIGLARFPSIAGHLAIADAEDPQDPLSPVYVSSGDFDSPVFSVNGSAVPVDTESWGDVKALFR